MIERLLEKLGPVKPLADGGIDQRVRTGLVGSH